MTERVEAVAEDGQIHVYLPERVIARDGQVAMCLFAGGLVRDLTVAHPSLETIWVPCARALPRRAPITNERGADAAPTATRSDRGPASTRSGGRGALS